MTIPVMPVSGIYSRFRLSVGPVIVQAPPKHRIQFPTCCKGGAFNIDETILAYCFTSVSGIASKVWKGTRLANSRMD